MDLFIILLSVYILVCAACPAIIARRRGLPIAEQIGIAAFGALTGWTVFGAISVWLFAMFDDANDTSIIILR